MAKKERSNSKRDKECLNESDEEEREGSDGIDEGFLQVASAKGHTTLLTSNINQKKESKLLTGSRVERISATGILGSVRSGSGDNQDA